MKYLLSICAILVMSFLSIIAQSNISDMLEKSIKAVVIVRVPDMNDLSKIFGITSSEPTMKANKWKLNSNITGATGFIVESNKKKYIITNAHVVQTLDQEDIQVITHSGEVFTARVVGGDTFYDIAVLECKGAFPSDIYTLQFRSPDKTLRVGEQVWAIGNPLLDIGNYQFSVTNGIVSGVGRIMNAINNKFGQIQHTATLANGNSGGPLIDSDGKIVGLNTQIGYAPSAYTMTLKDNVNMPLSQLNFSTDHKIVYQAFDKIVRDGRIVRAFIGIELMEDDNDDEEVTSLKKIFISGMMDNSPAYGKLEAGMIIKEINNKTIKTLDDALFALEDVSPGQTLRIRIENRGNEQVVNILTTALSDDRLEQIVDHIMSSYTNLRILKEEDDLFILSKRTKILDKRIIAAGWTDDIWEIRSKVDLGKVMRLTSIAGFIQIGYYDKNLDDFGLENIALPSPFRMKKILFY